MYDQVSYATIGAFVPSGPALARIASEHSYPLPQGAPPLGVSSCLNKANEISGEWPVQPMYIYEPTSGSWLGRMKDIWLGSCAQPAGPISGTLIPATGASQFTRFGPFVVPWPASLGAPVLT